MKLYIYDLTNMTDDTYDKILSQLTEETKNNILKNKMRITRLRHVAGELLKRVAVSSYLQREISYVDDIGSVIEENNIFYDFAFIKNFVICAVSDKQVGVAADKKSSDDYSLMENAFGKCKTKCKDCPLASECTYIESHALDEYRIVVCQSNAKVNMD